MTLNYLSLFSGIGGLDLGLDRAGWTCVGQVEIDAFCRRVLAKHWPEVPRHDDVRTAPGWWLGTTRPAVDLVCAGPPCQPASRAGRRLGDGDPRWGWPWFLDVVRAVRPEYALMENPAALLDLDRGAAFGWILAGLAALGFDAEWSVLSACAVGAPHVRERLFVVAHAAGVDGAAGLGSGDLQWPVAAGYGRSGPWGDPEMGMATAAGSDRVVDGVPNPVESARIHALGNAVVPQVAEHVGRLIRAHAEQAVAS